VIILLLLQQMGFFIVSEVAKTRERVRDLRKFVKSEAFEDFGSNSRARD
jgi:hypothetical protein